MDTALLADHLDRRASPRNPQGWWVRHLPTCDSTNRVARGMGALQPGRPILVVADHQEAGRGRQGRSWESDRGANLLFSVVLHPPVPPRDAARCVLVWAAALAEVLGAWLKWPNDLVDAQDRKVGGLLAELEGGSGAQVRHVVLGVGINVNQTLFPGLPQATSLALRDGHAHDRTALLLALVEALAAAEVTAPGALDAWRNRNRTIGRRVRIGDIVGTATALRADGALLVGEEAVLAGDVELVQG